MSVDVIKLGQQQEPEIELKPSSLANLAFRSHVVPDPAMSIWLMNLKNDAPIFPWWNIDSELDPDVKTLDDTWGISTPQSLFDCLFLSQLGRCLGPNLYAIIPGYVKTDGWNKLQEPDRQAFLKGQGCIYHLEGNFNDRLSINWVPFGQPQSIVRDLSFGSLWRLFVATQPPDSSKSFCFFSLKDARRLPEIANLLIKEDDKRSEHMAGLVDWFGAYMSPLKKDFSTCGVFYTQKKESVPLFSELQRQFQAAVEAARALLVKEPEPKNVIKVLSRLIAL